MSIARQVNVFSQVISFHQVSSTGTRIVPTLRLLKATIQKAPYLLLSRGSRHRTILRPGMFA